jgi:hypothetical protein
MMLALLARLAGGPLMRAALPLGLAVMAMALIFYALHRADMNGRQKALEAVRAANERAAGKADAAERQVLTCPPGLWNRETRRCVIKEH